MAIVRAVAVPSEPNRSGTTTKSVEAGVTQESVRRVPPTTPMERLRCVGPVSVASGAAVSRGRSVSVMRRFRSTRADASGGWRGAAWNPDENHHVNG